MLLNSSWFYSNLLKSNKFFSLPNFHAEEFKLWSYFERVVKTAFFISLWTNWDNSFSWNKNHICLSDSERKLIWIFSGKNPWVWAKQPSTCPTNVFEGKFFPKKNTFVVFGIPEKFFSDSWRWRFSRLFENYTPHDQMHTLNSERIFLQVNVLFPGVGAKSFPNGGEIILAVLWKFYSTRAGRKFGEKSIIFFEPKSFLLLARKFLRGLSERYSGCRGGHFERKWKKLHFFLRIGAK